MSIAEKMAEALGKKSETTETPSDQTGSEETKNSTLEQVIGSTGQNDHDDEEKQAKASDPKDSVIISLKRQLRDTKRETAEVKGLVQELTNLVQNETKAKLSEAKIVAFAEKTGADPDSIRELAELLRDEVAPQKEDKTSKASKVQPKIEDEDEDDNEDELPKFNKSRLTKAVNQLVDEFMDEMPEYDDIFDSEDLKEIILSNPNKYARMPIIQIVEKFYGRAVKGKKGIESVKPAGTSHQAEKKTGGKLTDKEFEAIKDDPEAMKDYRKDLVSRIQKAGLY